MHLAEPFVTCDFKYYNMSLMCVFYCQLTAVGPKCDTEKDVKPHSIFTMQPTHFGQHSAR